MATDFCSALAERVTFECLETYGGYGFTRDYPRERCSRESKMGKIHQGASVMQLQTIAKTLLRR